MKLTPQDQDFIDYWWRMVDKQLRARLPCTTEATKKEGAERASASTASVDRGPWLEKEELDVTEDEMQLIREMEEEERRVRQQQDGAAQEFQQLQDSQEKEDMAEVAHQQVLQEASAYREGVMGDVERDGKGIYPDYKGCSCGDCARDS